MQLSLLVCKHAFAIAMAEDDDFWGNNGEFPDSESPTDSEDDEFRRSKPRKYRNLYNKFHTVDDDIPCMLTPKVPEYYQQAAATSERWKRNAEEAIAEEAQIRHDNRFKRIWMDRDEVAKLSKGPYRAYHLEDRRVYGFGNDPECASSKKASDAFRWRIRDRDPEVRKNHPWVDASTAIADRNYFRKNIQPKLSSAHRAQRQAWADESIDSELYPEGSYLRTMHGVPPQEADAVYKDSISIFRPDLEVERAAFEGAHAQWVHDRCVRGPRLQAALDAEAGDLQGRPVAAPPLPVYGKFLRLRDRIIEDPANSDSDSSHPGYEEDSEDPEGFEAFKVEYRKSAGGFQ